ncbi:MAG: MBL fold metallo-hydrolase [Bdellovibrionales bacterium]|nr:MBL fold metallo-hydrolase [Bdellovibrionales bacterium]
MNQSNSDPTIQFLGATKTVTGSKTLLKVFGKKILVDCGLFQGPKAIRELNWQEFKEAESIDAVILTHAHIDHSGYLPKLVKEGFKGPIYCSAGTFDLCQIMLMDSAHLQEEDAKYANKSRYSKHYRALPLYETVDAQRALELFVPLEMNDWTDIFPMISVRLLRAGHILGSSFVQIKINRDYNPITVTFSGDIGNGRQNVIKGPVSLVETDYLVMEGTYGDRVQSKLDPSETLAQCIRKVAKNKGVLVIPSFAVGRTQEILYLLRKLESENKIPEIPVYLDSPMAVEATEIYMRHKDELKLDLEKGGFIEPLCSHSYKTVRSADDSMLLCMKDGPMVVVSAAGMLTGGRVLHHLKARLPKPENVVLFVGWQAEETKGRLLQQGLPKIRIHHQEVDIEAEIVSIDSLSAHGDTEDILSWIKGIEKAPHKVFLNHGEESALNTLKYRLEHELNFSVVVPSFEQEFVLS